MLVEITESSFGYFYWKLFDGPDGIDAMAGYTDTLEQAFERVSQARQTIARSYVEDAEGRLIKIDDD